MLPAAQSVSVTLNKQTQHVLQEQFSDLHVQLFVNTNSV